MQLMGDEESSKYEISAFLGFNQAVDAQFLQPGQTNNAQNIDISDGNLSTCRGFSKYTAIPFTGGVKTLMAFYKNNPDGSQSSYLLGSSDTTLYYLNNNAEWKILKTGLLNGKIDFINYQKDSTDLIIMGNGYNDILKWDGVDMVAQSLGGTPPKMKSIALHFERIWGTGDSSNPNTVYYSADLDPENWTQTINGGGVIDIPTWDGGVCIGISTIFNDVVIFKTNNIFRIYGTYPGEYGQQQIFTTTGAIAERSIVNAVNEAFFLAKDGIYLYNGTQTLLISEPIKEVISSMNKSYAENACGVFFNNKYILAIPSGSSTVNNTVIEYDVSKQSFIVKKGINANTFLKYNDKLLFGNDDTVSGYSYVYEYNTGNTLDGASIESFWETPINDLNTPNAVKRSTYFYATVKGSGQMKLEATFDNKTTEIIIDLPANETVIKKRIRNKGRRFKFKFSNINGSEFKIINPKIFIDVDLD